ncbi:hypothetical protein [Stenotrophomonas maltophilia]|uniref:hypothetical protein n=1 Tax=Stenotrophomonas maltophilia TaxID=40324 RepID=UPI0013DB4A84|nr:hypothetical protein [Stenotrophomonas maltophilia]
MSTDKTLANVQPGGRVRQGDQAELDRLEFQAWARELLPCPFCGNGAEFVPYKDNGLTLKCKSMGCIQRNQRTLRYGIDWLRTSMAEHWNTRALSAQSSPRGQVDALPDQARKLFDELGAIADDYRCVAILAAALAARQPVGKPAYNSAGISLTACQLHEALLMAGDPELDVPFEDRSLVRIFWTETGHSGPGLYCECVGAEEEGCILLDGTAPAIGQSAQAVDLGLQLDRYDAGLLGDGGGGDVNWWQDYIRAELDRAHEFYQDQADAHG